MAKTITLTISDADQARVADAFAAECYWQATIDGAPNPEDKNAFASRMIAKSVQDFVRSYETKVALAAVAKPAPVTVGNAVATKP